MSENLETKDTGENQEQGQQNESTNNEQQISPIEQRALEMGWRPKEEFDGDETDFIDAAEFVRRKPLFDKIDTVGKELRETRKALKALQEHHAKVKEAEFKHALEQLRAEKKQALADGDAERLIEIDEQIAEAKAINVQAAREAQQPQQQQAHPNFIRWVEQNDWYAKDGEMRALADQLGTSYAASNPDITPDEVLGYVSKRIRKIFPDKFQNPNKNRPSAVEGSSNAPSRSQASNEKFDLTDDERRAMNTFIHQGIMTKDEYINELKRVKGVA